MKETPGSVDNVANFVKITEMKGSKENMLEYSFKNLESFSTICKQVVADKQNITFGK